MQRILVTGATGYIGGRLVPELVKMGYSVRCLARDARKLEGKWESANLEVVQGDLLKPDTLIDALENVDVAYYLVHSMGAAEKGFEERDRDAALAFARAAAQANVKRIIFLGGLGKRSEEESKHLASRHETGNLLRSGSVPVTELRAAMIIGSGSASFEILKYLTERLPIMVCPRWIKTKTQPIFIEDALRYLVSCLEVPETAGKVLDIGGPDILTYEQMMLAYAQVRGLKRYIITVPVLTPRLSAYWVNLVTPVPASIACPLIEGLKTETVMESEEIRRLIPFPTTQFQEAVTRALDETNEFNVVTRWTSAQRGGVAPRLTLDPAPKGLIMDRQQEPTQAPEIRLREAFMRIGGKVGWYYGDWLWTARGVLDRAVGGVGTRRGRRHPLELATGEAVDFWRVEDLSKRRLLLRAEMRLPGRAWLEFVIEEVETRRYLRQTAYYIPRNAWGYLYWYLLFPFHFLIFRGMAKGIVRWAEKQPVA
jgi:uncharacterized protein YbjT (DUF2867 family)